MGSDEPSTRPTRFRACDTIYLVGAHAIRRGTMGLAIFLLAALAPGLAAAARRDFT